MSGSKHRRKGTRVENKLKNMLVKAGVQCRRQPESGAFGTVTGQEDLTGDLYIEGRYRAEVKARKNGEGFKTLEAWMGNNHFLFLVRDRRSPLVCMSWERYIELQRGPDGSA